MANKPLKGFIADIPGSIVVEAAIDAARQNLADAMAGKDWREPAE